MKTMRLFYPEILFKSERKYADIILASDMICQGYRPYMPASTNYTADRLLLQFYFQKCYLKRSAVGVITENPIGVQYRLENLFARGYNLNLAGTNNDTFYNLAFLSYTFIHKLFS